MVYEIAYTNTLKKCININSCQKLFAEISALIPIYITISCYIKILHYMVNFSNNISYKLIVCDFCFTKRCTELYCLILSNYWITFQIILTQSSYVSKLWNCHLIIFYYHSNEKFLGTLHSNMIAVNSSQVWILKFIQLFASLHLWTVVKRYWIVSFVAQTKFYDGQIWAIQKRF